MNLLDIGQEIKSARKKRKLSQSAVAKALGLEQATISRVESGDIDEIGIKKVLAILDYVGLEIRVTPFQVGYNLEEIQAENRKEDRERKGGMKR